jgi:hypothetical protein
MMAPGAGAGVRQAAALAAMADLQPSLALAAPAVRPAWLGSPAKMATLAFLAANC